MKKTILVIEDDKGILEAMEMALQFEGYDVIPCTNAEYAEAVMKGKEAAPNLVLCDMLLSGQDGREICKKFKATKLTKTIPVGMMSAHPQAAVSVKEAGADFFLAKPFDIENLLSTIKKYM